MRGFSLCGDELIPLYFDMSFYIIGCYAALEKLAFGPKEVPRIMKLVKPVARHSKREMGSVDIPSMERLGILEDMRTIPSRMSPKRIKQQRSFAQGSLERLNKMEPRMFLPEKGEAASSIAKAMGKGKPGRRARALAGSMTPQQKKVMDSMVAGHELDELVLSRHMKPGIQNPFEEYGHVNPRVILREHARVATLPKSQQPVREFQQLMRAHFPGPRTSQMFKPTTPIPNEAELLEMATRGVGGRPGIAYGTPGTRLSRSAQKRVSYRMQEILDKISRQYDVEAKTFYEKSMARRVARRSRR